MSATAPPLLDAPEANLADIEQVALPPYFSWFRLSASIVRSRTCRPRVSAGGWARKPVLIAVLNGSLVTASPLHSQALSGPPRNYSHVILLVCGEGPCGFCV